jgi:hypothetical protein
MDTSNDYLNQVVAEQAKVEGELRQRQARAILKAGGAGASRRRKGAVAAEEEHEDFDLAMDEEGTAGRSVNYRITGFWRWKAVVVAPNVYVVHTRRGHAEPLHVGMGLSFRYDPATDAFLVIPAVVQTLLINARCICRERAGILVQAYVQWIVEDVRTAYRKLDFSDPEDPMRIVSVQLREQAEAAIKDKVATMSIEDVLSDKQPIIEELTHRLRAVAEGSHDGDPSSGLGLKIVTVQIKEAVVSSTRLWENLQKPFRAEREKLARLAELETAQQIALREGANRQKRATDDLEIESQLAQLRATQERETYERDQAEKVRRHLVEQEAEQRAIAERTVTEKARREADLELALQQIELEKRKTAEELEALRREMELDRIRAERDRLRATAAAERDNLTHDAQVRREEREVVVFRQRRAAENDLSPQNVQARLIDRLPQIAASLPRPTELKAVTIGPEAAGTTSSLVGFLASVLHLADGTPPKTENGHPAQAT